MYNALLTLLGFIITNVQAQSFNKYCTSLHWACDPSTSGDTFFSRVANQAVSVIEGFLGAIAVAAIIWGGALLVTSGANEENRAKGKSIIINTIVGVTLAILATEFVQFIYALVSAAAG